MGENFIVRSFVICTWLKKYCWGDDVREEETDLHVIFHGEMDKCLLDFNWQTEKEREVRNLA